MVGAEISNDSERRIVIGGSEMLSAGIFDPAIAYAALGHLQVSAAMQQDAHLCYYLTQCCNWVFSPFNPSDFQDWGGLDPKQLLADAAVQTVLASLQHNIPVAVLNHEAALARHRAADPTPSSP